MKKKKLVILFWDLGIGGIQKRIRDITQDISKHRESWTVYILIRRNKNEGFYKQLLLLENVHILTYSFDNKKFRPPLGFIWWITLMYVRLKPDVLLTFLPPLSLVIVIIKLLIVWIRSRIIINDGVYISEYLRLRRQTWLKPFVRILYPHADAIIVPSNACKDDFIHNFSLHPDLIEVVPNWTLLNASVPLKPYYDILYIGRYDYEKNVLSLLDVISQVKKDIPTVTLLLVGSGPLLERLQKEILTRHLDENMRIANFDPDVMKYLRRTKLLVLPSLNEGMPNVVLEAAMCYVPSIVNNFQGANEVITNNKNGYITQSSEEMGLQIRNLLLNKKRRNAMGKAAYTYVSSRFTYRTQHYFIDALLN